MTGFCVIEGCLRFGIVTRGLCRSHYERWRKRGTTEPFKPPTIERLAARTIKMPNGCIEWIGGRNKYGYGHMSVDNKAVGTHRLAWELTNGPIRDGLWVLHRCDNPPCCNPVHLFLGTHADNTADMVAKGRSPKGGSGMTHCRRGHAFDETNTHVSSDGRRRWCRTCKKASEARRKIGGSNERTRSF